MTDHGKKKLEPWKARPPPIWQRSREWSKAKEAKLTGKRQELAKAGKDWRSSDRGGASAGDHVESFWRYNQLVGESDGGECLSEAAYSQLKARAREAAKDRLFCTWRNLSTGMDCVAVGPMSRCFCGHSYRAHDFMDNKGKRVGCRCEGCSCAQFEYMLGRGSSWIRCGRCKHAHDEHRRRDGTRGGCTHAMRAGEVGVGSRLRAGTGRGGGGGGGGVGIGSKAGRQQQRRQQQRQQRQLQELQLQAAGERTTTPRPMNSHRAHRPRRRRLLS